VARRMSRVSPRPVAIFPLDDERLGVNDDLRRWLPWIAVAVIAIIVIAAISFSGGG